MSVGKLLLTDEDMGSKFVAASETGLSQVTPGLNPVPAPSHRKPAASGKCADLIHDAMLERFEATVCCC